MAVVFDLFEEQGFEKLIQAIRYQIQKNTKIVKHENINLSQPKDIIQQLKQEINKLELSSHEKEYIDLQINILNTQLKSNPKHSTIIRAVLETIHQLVKDVASKNLIKIFHQIEKEIG